MKGSPQFSVFELNLNIEMQFRLLIRITSLKGQLVFQFYFVKSNDPKKYL